ncbi:MAG: peptidylprolyl isomerase [Algoriphagus aquaeductus]|uniref:Peptidyl-prolyl cis-trans isomerase n=1 Tax=Algoriphagus aquaeductus TaxID=475299 RepID=A0A326S095_9BACT|nr:MULTISPECIES: peptidylprolyl isomerase [Algoriphagus]PZV87463.1 peptidyl-prolyl cis-trans isomerase B (cyclophilin B) [Algoriphagus aquaeductus]
MKLFFLLVALTHLFITDPTLPVGKITTPLGEIWISLDDRTPNHKQSFIQLAESGYWDSLSFNRVIPNFVAQGGCPDTPEGFNDPDYLLKPEFHPELTHVYGAVGAGRDDNPDKLSARCQFYIVQNRDGLHRLDGNYTVFGKVLKGMEIIDRIVQVERNQLDEPLSPISLQIEIVYLSSSEYTHLLNSPTQ